MIARRRSNEFRLVAVSRDGFVVSMRVQWVLLDEGGAVRVRDGAIWRGAIRCGRCGQLGYDHEDPDDLVEAQRIGVAHAPDVQECACCGKATCDDCADETGTMCLNCFAQGPQ